MAENFSVNASFGLKIRQSGDWICKPGSVRRWARQASIFTRRCRRVQALRLCHHKQIRRSACPEGCFKVLLRIEFTASACLHVTSELLPHFSTLTGKIRRYISVALVRGSPLAGVTRYPCPMEPGLSSRTGFRLVPAVVRPAHASILIIFHYQVNIISCKRGLKAI